MSGEYDWGITTILFFGKHCCDYKTKMIFRDYKGNKGKITANESLNAIVKNVLEIWRLEKDLINVKLEIGINIE